MVKSHYDTHTHTHTHTHIYTYIYIYIYIYIYRGEGWLGFPDLWSGQKPWWNWYLTLVVNVDEVLRAQLAESTFLTSTLVPLGSFRSFKVCSDAKGRVGCGKQTGSYLKPCFLSLQWKTCLRQNWNLHFCTCSEGTALGQNTMVIITNSSWENIDEIGLSGSPLAFLIEKIISNFKICS